MNTMMKAMLASMSATTVFAKGQTTVVEITDANMRDTDFELNMGNTLEFHWKAAFEDVPFQEPEHLEIQQSTLHPQPFSVLPQGKECEDTTERISMPDQSLAKYVVDGRTRTWKNISHSEFDGVFTDMTVVGPNDWNYGHNRLRQAGQSSVEIDYNIPFAEIREHYPNATFKLKSAYFAPWRMSDLIVETTVNGHIVHDSVEVAPENEGRTVHTANLNDILADDEDGTIVMKYERGWGTLFLWYFEIIAENLDQEITEQMCTWKWLVQPQHIFRDTADARNAEVSYDLKFKTPDNQEHVNSLTIVHNH